MRTEVMVDKAGRIVVPKGLRERFHLDAGSRMEIAGSTDEITLRPVRPARGLVRRHGFWMLETGQEIPASVTDGVLQAIREERDLANLGMDA